MKSILFTRTNTAELVDEPIPDVTAGSVRVRLVRSCISSGTERAILSGAPNAEVSILSDSPEVSWPRRSGYSSAGVVEAVGEGVSGIAVGDRVALSWSHHSQFVTVPAGKVHKIPDNVSFEHAALTHIATFPLVAIRKSRLELGEPAIVMGQGVLGQLAVILLRAAGATPVIAADPDSAKRERALALGADAALDPTDPDFAAHVKALCPSEHKAIQGYVPMSGAAVAIEVTGVGPALDTVLDAIAPFGRVVLLGCSRKSNFSIDYYHKVHGRGVTLIGANSSARASAESSPGNWTTHDDALAFLRLLSLRRISLDGFVSEVHSPDECAAVYSRLATEKTFPVVQFDWTRLS